MWSGNKLFEPFLLPDNCEWYRTLEERWSGSEKFPAPFGLIWSKSSEKMIFMPYLTYNQERSLTLEWWKRETHAFSFIRVNLVNLSKIFEYPKHMPRLKFKSVSRNYDAHILFAVVIIDLNALFQNRCIEVYISILYLRFIRYVIR